LRSIEIWSDWAILEPDSGTSFWLDHRDEEEVIAAQRPDLAAPQLSPHAGQPVFGLPSTDSWLFESEPTLWSGLWTDERSGLQGEDSGVAEVSERWFEFDGLQRIDASADWYPGPLFDSQGFWVGWATRWEVPGKMLAPSANRTDPPATVVWCFPVEPAQQRVWTELLEQVPVEFGFLGIRPRAASDSVRQRGHRGVTVYEAAPATPAARAELQYGDLITHLDGVPVDSPNRLLWEIAARRPGAELQVTLLRGTLTDRPIRIEKEILLSKRPDIDDSRFPRRIASRIEIDWATASVRFTEVADRLPRGGGVRIASRHDELPESLESLREGDWIVAVGEQVPENPQEFLRLVLHGPDSLDLELLGIADAAARKVSVPRTAVLDAITKP